MEAIDLIELGYLWHSFTESVPTEGKENFKSKPKTSGLNLMDPNIFGEQEPYFTG